MLMRLQSSFFLLVKFINQKSRVQKKRLLNNKSSNIKMKPLMTIVVRQPPTWNSKIGKNHYSAFAHEYSYTFREFFLNDTLNEFMVQKLVYMLKVYFLGSSNNIPLFVAVMDAKKKVFFCRLYWVGRAKHVRPALCWYSQLPIKTWTIGGGIFFCFGAKESLRKLVNIQSWHTLALHVPL
jgi:hypothetical protein